ncbi:head-tail joining protein [Sagittula stellata]|uniref:Uncharacterized protein n=1 Tax=Sagittula stellata (strain ATCC 700073 / DSM 11524 / E-37) TaxID=388399 RepID=A3K1Z9_SAGS3|nr:hypothetical protein [Sagittula stellata]EBA08945.1 hypothetical protein SSE37_04845 [Sagittula stellata E-37]
MNAFEAGLGVLHADANMAEDVTYTPLATGLAQTVRAIATAPDVEVGFGLAKVHASTVVLEVAVSAVENPRPGDVILWRGETRIVQGEPDQDVERLSWSLDTRPA